MIQPTHYPLTAQPHGPAVMSSLVIAEITGKAHKEVMRDIRATLKQVGIGERRFALTYYDSQNKQRPCYGLPRRECDLVISGYSATYRLAIIDRWQELEAAKAPALPATFSDALRLAADLQDQLDEVAPKIEFFDRVTSSAAVCQIAVAVQVLKLPFGRNILFQKLREMGVLIKSGERYNLPLQEYVDRGLFTVNQHTYAHPRTGKTMISTTPGVTQKGLAWLGKHFGTNDQHAGPTADGQEAAE